MTPSPAWLALRAKLPRGRCLFCHILNGAPKVAAHRMIDTIGDRFGAGESVASLAADYDLTVEDIAEIVRMWSRPRRREYRERLEELMRPQPETPPAGEG